MRIIVENTDSITRPLDEQIQRWSPTIHYLSQTEVHVYALSIGASVLLSFFPFLIVMLTIVRDVFHFPPAERALVLALGGVLPAAVRGAANQVLSLFLLILCGGMALGSVLLTAMNTRFVSAQYGIQVFPVWMSLAIFKLGAIPITILSLFLVYWILPNRSVPVRRVLPVAVMVGLGLELVKYLFLLAWPWLEKKFQNEYGPFSYSVSIVVFSLLTSLLVLAGAEWSARAPAEDLAK